MKLSYTAADLNEACSEKIVKSLRAKTQYVHYNVLLKTDPATLAPKTFAAWDGEPVTAREKSKLLKALAREANIDISAISTGERLMSYNQKVEDGLAYSPDKKPEGKGARIRAQSEVVTDQSEYQDDLWDHVAAQKARQQIVYGATLKEKELVAHFGCSDPVVRLLGSGFYHTFDMPFVGKRIPPDLRWIVDKCGLCTSCWGTKAHQIGQRSVLATMTPDHFETDPLEDRKRIKQIMPAVLITRTMSRVISTETALCLYADWDYRNQVKQFIRRKGRSVTMLTAHEYGPQNLQRHFHDLMIGITWAEMKYVLQGVHYRSPIEGGEMVKAERFWQYGLVHGQDVMSNNEITYTAKYCAKAAGLKRAPQLANERQRLLDAGEPILDRYIHYPNRPWLGRDALLALAEAQKDRLLYEHARQDDHEAAMQAQDCQGLIMPHDPFVDSIIPPDPVPVCLSRKDRLRLNDALEERWGVRGILRPHPDLIKASQDAMGEVIDAAQFDHERPSGQMAVDMGTSS